MKSALGFHEPDDEDAPPPPNRAQRRAQEQHDARVKRRGQRAWKRRQQAREQALTLLEASDKAHADAAAAEVTE